MKTWTAYWLSPNVYLVFQGNELSQLYVVDIYAMIADVGEGSYRVSIGSDMLTAIEKFLYGSGGPHGVVGIALSPDRLIVSVASWTSLSAVKEAEFMEPKIKSIDVYADDPDDLNLPWDIIGVDSYPLSETRWKFGLTCVGIEYVFESNWPTLRTP